MQQNHQPSLASGRRERSGWLDFALAAAIALFAVGLFAPLFTVEKLLIFTDTVSIASSLVQLVQQGYVLLFVLVLAFTVCLPTCKLVLLARVHWSRCEAAARWLPWVERVAKWSMLDVFVVAVLVLSIKLDYIAEIRLQIGLYAFAASVLLSLWIAARLRRRLPTPASVPRDANEFVKTQQRID